MRKHVRRIADRCLIMLERPMGDSSSMISDGYPPPTLRLCLGFRSIPIRAEYSYRYRIRTWSVRLVLAPPFPQMSRASHPVADERLMVDFIPHLAMGSVRRLNLGALWIPSFRLFAVGRSVPSLEPQHGHALALSGD